MKLLNEFVKTAAANADATRQIKDILKLLKDPSTANAKKARERLELFKKAGLGDPNEIKIIEKNLVRMEQGFGIK